MTQRQGARCVGRAGKLSDAHAGRGARATGSKWRFRCICSVEAMPDDPRMQAFLYGPLVLAGDLGDEGLTEAHITGPNLRVGAADVEQHGSPLAPSTGRRRSRPRHSDVPSAGTDSSRGLTADTPHVFALPDRRRTSPLPLNRLFDRRYCGVLAGHLSETPPAARNVSGSSSTLWFAASAQFACPTRHC